MIGWPVAWKCAVACRFGELSQQPTSPQIMHSRRCTHLEPIFRHSEQPSVLDGVTSISIWSRCEQLFEDTTLSLLPDKGPGIDSSAKIVLLRT